MLEVKIIFFKKSGKLYAEEAFTLDGVEVHDTDGIKEAISQNFAALEGHFDYCFRARIMGITNTGNVQLVKNGY